MNGHVPVVLAVGPHIDVRNFKPWPPMAIVFIVALLLGVLFVYLGRRVSMTNDPIWNIVYGVLALLSITTAVMALSQASPTQGFFRIIRNIEEGIGIGLNRQGAAITIAAVGAALCLLAAWWYVMKEWLPAAILFAVLVIVLAGSSIVVSDFLGWYANTIVAFINNFSAGMMVGIFPT